MRRILAVVLCLIGLSLAATVAAQDAALYEGEAPVTDQGAAARAAALPRALAQVFDKVTGEAGAGARRELAPALADAASLMQQYRYRQDVDSRDGTPQVRLYLIARFDQVAVDALIGKAGLPIWPSPRPKPLLWLAIDDGRGARLVGESQAGAVASLTRRGAERGLGFSFPKADLADQTVGGAQAVWRDDMESVRTAATRYGRREPLLVGRMERSGGGWSAQWKLIEHGRELYRWTTSDADAAVVLAGGADGAANAFAQAYAEMVLGGEPGDYAVLVGGLEDATDYGRALQYLQKLPIVQAVQVVEAGGDRVQLLLSLRAGVEGLVRLVDGGGVLTVVSAGTPDAPPEFRLER
jgi:hypothetical protein